MLGRARGPLGGQAWEETLAPCGPCCLPGSPLSFPCSVFVSLAAPAAPDSLQVQTGGATGHLSAHLSGSIGLSLSRHGLPPPRHRARCWGDHGGQTRLVSAYTPVLDQTGININIP